MQRKAGICAALLVLPGLVLARPAIPSVPTHAEVTVVLPQGGRYTDADAALSWPNFTPALVRKLANEGRLAAAHHRWDAVQINFDRARRIDPDSRYLLWSYGWAQLNLGRPGVALDAFQRNLAMRPDLRPQWVPMAMALTYIAADDPAAALAWYRTAAQSDPLRWGTDAAALRSSLHWSTRERALLRRLIETAARERMSATRFAAVP